MTVSHFRLERGRVLLVGAALVGLGLTSAFVARTRAVAPEATTARGVVQAAEQVSLIDGADNPSLIPDSVAFSMVFHILADHNANPRRTYAYIHFIGIGSSPCNACPLPSSRVTRADVATAAADTKTLLSIVDQFKRGADAVDAQSAALYHAHENNLTSEIHDQLKQLYQQKLALAEQLADALATQLSADSEAKLRNFIDTHVKPRVKMVAAGQ